MSHAEGAIQWNRLEELFHAALELDPAQRATFLHEACGDDVGLREEIESLLAFSGESADSLIRPVEAVAQGFSLRDTGQELGPYRLIRLLGDGGMGQVYLAERADNLYEQKVAVKLVHSGLKQTGAMLLRFAAERRILANLNHPNVARLLDAGVTQNGVPYIVMEYIDGMHIDAYCRKHGLGQRQTAELFLHVCGAVEYAHRNLVIHRDIKPANIVVDASGVPKLLDFGIAKLLDTENANAITRVTERIMTPEYASPEQVRGEQVTTATDVYALGVLLFELLTGERPFHLDHKSPLDAIRVICDQAPPAPSMAGRTKTDAHRTPSARIDRDLDNIVLMAMRKEPTRRYASVSALSGDLRAWLSGYPVQARTDRWSYRSQKFIRRHKLALAGAGLFLLALIGFSIGAVELARRADRARLTAERETRFLNTIFQASTPDAARGKPVMARDLLDQGAKRIDAELADQPELQATMLDNVGRAYLAIGSYPQSIALLQRAFQVQHKILRDSSLQTASTEDALATALRMNAQYAEADQHFRNALAIRRQHLPESSLLVAESLSNLGECLYLEGTTQQADSTLRESLAMFDRLDRDGGSAPRNYLALVLEREGNFPEAVQLLREAVEIDARIKGTESPDYLVSLHNYAGALIDAGNLDAAESTERQVLALRDKTSGPHHPDTFYPLNNLGFILLEKGEWKQALPFLERCVDLCRKVGIQSRTAIALGNRARAFEQKGDYAAAERDLREAESIATHPQGQKSRVMVKILDLSAMLSMDRGDSAQAVDYASQAVDMERGLDGEGTPGYASARTILGDASLLHGDAPQAESSYRQAVAIRRTRLNPGNPGILAAQLRLGEALSLQGKSAEAESLLREIVSGLHGEPFPLPAWQTAEADYALGACLSAQGQSREGASLMLRSERALRNHPQAAFRWPAIVRTLGGK